jgi:phytoene synthase
MQLTNIARDVKEDAQMGRSYLPGITKPLEAKADDIAQAVRKILDRAETLYNLAIDGMDYLPWRSRTAIRVALEVYREIGRQIQRNGYCVMTGRTVLSKPRLLWVASRAVLFDMLSIVSLAVRRLLHPGLFSLKEPNMTKTSNLSDPQPMSTPNQAKQIAFLGLSLTSIMATALFVMVYFNPKSQEYSYLPLIYAVGSLLASVLFHRLSARYDKPSPQAT